MSEILELHSESVDDPAMMRGEVPFLGGGFVVKSTLSKREPPILPWPCKNPPFSAFDETVNLLFSGSCEYRTGIDYPHYWDTLSSRS